MEAPATSGRSKFTQRLIYAAAIVGAVLLVSYIVIVNFGNISGEEFSPSTFRRREFQYYEVPLVHMQVSPIFRTEVTDESELFLTGGSLVPTSTDADPWHLVYGRVGNSEPVRGDASILTDYLDAVHEDGSVAWEVWSTQHPALAQVLWPEVAAAAQRQQYLLIPELMELARVAAVGGTPQELQAAMDASIAANYARWGIVLEGSTE